MPKKQIKKALHSDGTEIKGKRNVTATYCSRERGKMEEDKQMICNALALTLRLTRNQNDLKYLRYYKGACDIAKHFNGEES